MQLKSPLTNYISLVINKLAVKRVLLTEVDKYGEHLESVIKSNANTSFTLQTRVAAKDYEMSLRFREHKNASVCHTITNTTDVQYNLIVSLFTGVDNNEHDLKIILNKCAETGHVIIILPEEWVAFGRIARELRKTIATKYYVESLYKLGLGLIESKSVGSYYMLVVVTEDVDNIVVGELYSQKNVIAVKKSQSVAASKLYEQQDWQVQQLLYQQNRRLQLSKIATAFRGKTVTSKQLSEDVQITNKEQIKVGVINISDMDIEGMIIYAQVASLVTETNKIEHHLLRDGDLLLACRGTVHKSVVYREKDGYEEAYIVSSNVIVLRLNSAELDSYYLKIFFDSPIGNQMLQKIQGRGKVISISPKDLLELEIPMISKQEQLRLATIYQRAEKNYYEEKKKNELRWSYKKAEIFGSIFQEHAIYLK